VKKRRNPNPLDSGAGGVFLRSKLRTELKVKEIALDKPIIARKRRRNPEQKGNHPNLCDLQFTIGEKQFKERFYITGLGKTENDLGLPWLKKHNPLVDWKNGTLTWQTNEFRNSY